MLLRYGVGGMILRDSMTSVEFPAPIHVSNVAVVCSKCGKAARVGFRLLASGLTSCLQDPERAAAFFTVWQPRGWKTKEGVRLGDLEPRVTEHYGVLLRVECGTYSALRLRRNGVEATVVQIADAISASRPGARGETLDNYVKRLEDLQQIALSFPGVERCYAIQAGREIRILVRPEDLDDLASSRLARDVVRKIEEQLQYPGQIKVTVIRETRAVDYAR